MPFSCRREPLRLHDLPPHGPQRARPAGPVARPLAQLRRHHAAGHPARGPAPRVRPRHHALRPRQQLRPARTARPRRTSAASSRPTCARTATSCVISSKAGYDMWPGPYGDGGSRKYLLSSLDQSLTRIGVDYVDIFYSHRPDPSVPIEETMGALHTAVTSGKALYAGISNYSPEQTRTAHAGPRRPRHPAAHPPAQLLDVQPAHRERGRRPDREPARRRRRAGHRDHRVLPAGAGPAHRPLPVGRGPRRLPRGRRPLPQARRDLRDVPVPRARPERGRGRPRAVARAAGPVLGAPRRPHHLGARRRQLGRPAGGQRRRPVGAAR